MELRYVDPRSVKENPDNPRKVAAREGYDDALVANIRAVGLIQPPIVREIDGDLVIRAGDRRRRCSIAAGLDIIPVLVMDTEAEDADSMRSFAENAVRDGYAMVDLYRAMQALAGDGWTEDAIATALNLTPRYVRRLKFCASLLPAILDQMALRDEPRDEHLRLIAQASRDEQAQAWKKLKPRKGERAQWSELARALAKRRMWARDAKFGDDLAEAYGIVWVEDLFEQGEQDNRYTTQVDAFLGAQQEWMANHLPKKATVLQTDDCGQPKLPPKALRVWGRGGKGTITGHYVREQDGSIETVTYQMPEPPAKTAKAAAASSDVREEEAPEVPQTPSRAPVTQLGHRMIGDFQTDALHEALSNAEIDDITLLGLFVLAAAGKNVEVRSGDTAVAPGHFARTAIADAVMPDCVLTRDPETVRVTARRMLRYMLTLRQTNWNADSGLVAKVAAEAIAADRYLPTMATDEFLSCLSKPEMERIASSHSVLPRQTGKATRAAFLERFKDERFIYPDARFVVPDDDRAAHTAAVQRHAGIQSMMEDADEGQSEDIPGEEPEEDLPQVDDAA